MMKHRIFPPVALLLLLLGGRAQAQSNVVLITHAGVPKPDATTVQRIYTGRVIEIAGVPVMPVNARGGALRSQFLQAWLKQDEETYIAYWTVRRYIGKGAPPRELGSPAEVIGYVESTPGAIGYVNEADLKPGANVIIVR